MTRTEAIAYADDRIASITGAINTWEAPERIKEYGEYAAGIAMEAHIQLGYWIRLKEALEHE